MANSLILSVSFTRRKFYDDKTRRDVHYVECQAEYEGESFRFKIADKDSRLFQYLMKQNGYPELSNDDRRDEEEEE
mgnify:CR=1 FL=1